MSRAGFLSPLDRAQAMIDQMSSTPEAAPVVEAPAVPTPEEASATPAVQPPAPTPEITPETAVTEDPNGGTFQARWETLKGMYRAANDEKQYLLSRVNTLEAQVSELSIALQQAQHAQSQAPAPAPAGNLNELLGQLSDEVGADLAGKIQQLIQTSISSQIAPVAEKVEHVSTDNLKTRQQGFELALTEKVPNWQAIFHNPAFNEWLDSNRETFSGLSYADCFKRANSAWDLNGLATIFNKFVEATTPPPQPAPETDPRLALVSPGRHGGGATEIAPTERYFKQSEVNAFYKDVALGKYRGREQEYTQLDAQIIQANMAGRIIPG